MNKEILTYKGQLDHMNMSTYHLYNAVLQKDIVSMSDKQQAGRYDTLILFVAMATIARTP